MTKIRIAARERIVRRWTIGRIDGFNLTCQMRPGQTDERVQPELFLERRDFLQSVWIDRETTAIGIIAGLEHALDPMGELQEQRRHVANARARLAGFEQCLGETFHLQGELDGKLEQLADIKADLAGAEGSVNHDRLAPASV